MDSFNKPTTLSLSGNVAQNWKRFKQQFEVFMEATGNNTKPEKRKACMFLNLVGEEALEMFNTLHFEVGESKENLDDLIKKFSEHCEPKKNIIYERHNFFTRSQEVGESFDHYLTTLRHLAKTCEFQNQEESLIRDRIVIGILDRNVREGLLRKPDLTCKKAEDYCRAAEISKIQAETIDKEQTKIEAVAKVSKPQGTGRKWTDDSHTNAKSLYDCKKCGSRHKPMDCPAFGKSCFKCRQKHHYSRYCTSRKIQSQTVMEDETEIQYVLVDMVKTENKERAWYINLDLEGTEVQFKIDSGAEASVLPASLYNRLKVRKPLEPSNLMLVGFGKNKIKPLGRTSYVCKLKSGSSFKLEFQVAQEGSQALLGLGECLKLNLIKRIDGIANKSNFERKYECLFEGMGTLPGEYHIEVDPNVKPVIHPSRRVPFALMPRLKVALTSLEKCGIIERVTKPTNWVNSLVIVEKPNGELRLCLDPKHLNMAIKREHFQIPTAEDLASRMIGKRVFSILDMKNGFLQVKLDEPSSELCTFNTPIGRYKFNRLPFGIKSAPEVFQRKCIEIFGDIQGIEIFFDDIIIAGKDEAEHDEILLKVMERAKEKGVKFNKDKFKFKVKEVKYMGHIISEQGLGIDEERLKAIAQMPSPTNKKELLRFLGMVNFLSKFVPNMSEKTAPLRDLLKTENLWDWQESQEEAVKQIKGDLCRAPILSFFDPEKEIVIQTDSSKDGMGACLMQNGHPIAYSSRALTSTEYNYAQIEKELLAIVFATEKYHQYIYGRNIIIESDHRPLETIVNKQEISKVTARLQRMMLKLLRYNITVKYVPGKYMYLADTLSRAHLKDPVEEDPEMTYAVHTIQKYMSITPQKKEEFIRNTKCDTTLQTISRFVKDGWPETIKKIEPIIRPYWKIRDKITESNGLLFNENRLIVPALLQENMLQLIHEGHQGIEKCKKKSRESLYWPGMCQQIERVITECGICAKFQAKNTKQSLMPHPVPDRPWKKLATDILEFKNKTYLAVKDYHSKWIEIMKLNSKTASAVIEQLRLLFSTHGIPEEIMSDNMPYGSQEFIKFAKEYDFTLLTSSPKYPQSNGMAENAVKIAKGILKKADEQGIDYHIPLLEYRNTPITGIGVSPAQLLMSRRLRTKIPMEAKLLKPKCIRGIKDKLERQQEVQKAYYDRGTHQLEDLNREDQVMVNMGTTWKKGKVIKKHVAPRSYIVALEQGGVYRRNRRDLRKWIEGRMFRNGESEEVLRNQERTKNQGLNQIADKDIVGIPRELGGRKRQIVKPIRYRDFMEMVKSRRERGGTDGELKGGDVICIDCISG